MLFIMLVLHTPLILHSVLGSAVQEGHKSWSQFSRGLARAVTGQKYVIFEKRLRSLGLFSLPKQQLSGGLIAAHSSLNVNGTDGKTKFLLVLADGTIRGNSPKMQLGRFSLDFRKKVIHQKSSVPME